MSVFLPATSPDDFRDCSRRYVVGRCFCYWQVDTRANGTMLWGTPREDDIAALEPYWSLGANDPSWDGHGVFIDARAVAGVDAFAFRRLLSYLFRTQQQLRNVGSLTMVHGGGLVGVVTAGLLSVVEPAYPFRVVSAEHMAGAFSASNLTDLFEEVERLRNRVGHTSDIVRHVRSVLSAEPDADANAVADRLGISARTLQRRLVADGTSLRRERQAHVMMRAEELLVGTSLDLDAVAAQLRLSSASHLVAYFRRVHGVTPGEWRSRNRADVGQSVAETRHGAGRPS